MCEISPDTAKLLAKPDDRRTMAGYPDLDAFVAGYQSAASNMISRLESCRKFWESIPESRRVQTLIEVLARYRQCRQSEDSQPSPDQLRASFALNELTTSCYALRPKPNESEALAILHTAFHTCGHGGDTVPPFDFALRHFRDKCYTPEFFDAVHAYRESLRHTKSTTAQALKGRMELILWQDWRTPGPWKSCWTSHIRADLRAMPFQAQGLWSDLFKSFHHCVQIEPTKKWWASTMRPLGQFTGQAFSSQVGEWLRQPVHVPRPQLSAAGSHVLKNLVWCAIPLNDPVLDRSLTRLIEVPWKNRQPMDKVAGALAFLWSLREPHQSLEYLELIAKPYAYPGGKIEQYFRSARDFSQISSWSCPAPSALLRNTAVHTAGRSAESHRGWRHCRRRRAELFSVNKPSSTAACQRALPPSSRR